MSIRRTGKAFSSVPPIWESCISYATVEFCWFTLSAGLPQCFVQTFAVTYDTKPRNVHERVLLKQEEVLHHNRIKGYEGLMWFHYAEKLGLQCCSGTFHSTSESSQHVQRQRDFRLSNPLDSILDLARDTACTGLAPCVSCIKCFFNIKMCR